MYGQRIVLLLFWSHRRQPALHGAGGCAPSHDRSIRQRTVHKVSKQETSGEASPKETNALCKLHYRRVLPDADRTDRRTRWDSFVAAVFASQSRRQQI